MKPWSQNNSFSTLVAPFIWIWRQARSVVGVVAPAGAADPGVGRLVHAVWSLVHGGGAVVRTGAEGGIGGRCAQRRTRSVVAAARSAVGVLALAGAADPGDWAAGARGLVAAFLSSNRSCQITRSEAAVANTAFCQRFASPMRICRVGKLDQYFA